MVEGVSEQIFQKRSIVLPIIPLRVAVGLFRTSITLLWHQTFTGVDDDAEAEGDASYAINNRGGLP